MRALAEEIALRLPLAGAPRRDVTWMFIATLPNSGSTAFAKVLTTSPRAVGLNDRLEGQWLVPALSKPGDRWRADLPVDYDRVRRVWLRRVRRLSGPCVVVEKSPANLCRFAALTEAFADMRIVRVRFARDPYAICASWARRYRPETVARDWAPDLADELRDPEGYFRVLGRLCGERMAMLRALAPLCDATVTYEALTADPRPVIETLRALCPELGRVDAGAAVAVKDYAPSPLENMNARQLATLDARSLRLVTEGLEPAEDAVRAFGYTLRR